MERQRADKLQVKRIVCLLCRCWVQVFWRAFCRETLRWEAACRQAAGNLAWFSRLHVEWMCYRATSRKGIPSAAPARTLLGSNWLRVPAPSAQAAADEAAAQRAAAEARAKELEQQLQEEREQLGRLQVRGRCHWQPGGQQLFVEWACSSAQLFGIGTAAGAPAGEGRLLQAALRAASCVVVGVLFGRACSSARLFAWQAFGQAAKEHCAGFSSISCVCRSGPAARR